MTPEGVPIAIPEPDGHAPAAAPIATRVVAAREHLQLIDSFALSDLDPAWRARIALDLADLRGHLDQLLAALAVDRSGS